MLIPPNQLRLTILAIIASAPGAQHPHVYSCSGSPIALRPATESSPAQFDPLFHKPFDAAMTFRPPTLLLHHGVHSPSKSHRKITASAAKRTGPLQTLLSKLTRERTSVDHPCRTGDRKLTFSDINASIPESTGRNWRLSGVAAKRGAVEAHAAN
jgi:hypothetical protein